MSEKRKMMVFEAFAGIGAQNKALKNIKCNFDIVGLAEWYVPAIIGYHAMHDDLKISSQDVKDDAKEIINYLSSKPLSIDSKNLVSTSYWKKISLNQLKIIYKFVKFSANKGNIFDIRDLYKKTLKGIDLLTYSFPCQDLSQQGKQKGISKNTHSRSGLLWEIEKALDNTEKKYLPKYLLMENVTALSHYLHRQDLNEWLNKLEKLGYKNNLKILNSAEFGSPQARNRVFMISSLDDKVLLPRGTKTPSFIKKIMQKEARKNDILENLSKYEISSFKKTKSNINKAVLLNYTNFDSESRIYDPKFTGPILTATGANSRIKVLHEGKIRKLNAKECLKYMGFTNLDYKKISYNNFLTEQQIIFLAGNSISIEPLNEIMNSIINDWYNL